MLRWRDQGRYDFSTPFCYFLLPHFSTQIAQNNLPSLFGSHRLRSLLDGGFPLGLVGGRRFSGRAGEEDQVVSGLSDLEERRESEHEAAGKTSTALSFLHIWGKKK